MRFSDYLIALPEADQRALPVDLALGYGRLQLAERLHRESPPAAAMLGLLGAAHAALRAAQATLDPGAPTDDGPAPAAPTDALPPGWDALMGEGQGDIVGALLAMAAEMARDAVAAIRDDADVTAVRDLVRDSLHLLADVRDDSLGTT